jgi:exosome complex component RRP4
MRNIFKETDLITAEVHCKTIHKIYHFEILIPALNNDRTTNLHTRSLKYGKLENGILVSVHNKLVFFISYSFFL